MNYLGGVLDVEASFSPVFPWISHAEQILGYAMASFCWNLQEAKIKSLVSYHVNIFFKDYFYMTMKEFMNIIPIYFNTLNFYINKTCIYEGRVWSDEHNVVLEGEMTDLAKCFAKIELAQKLL